MYSTCIFCHAPLGANEALRDFPVGRRLAYDPARGRLWVICRRCARWNLTPLEERWEAIEECERLVGNTAPILATDNIALSRLKDGTDLVRIGTPPRAEFAAWRYGRRLVRRRREAMLLAGASVLVFGGIMAGGVQTGLVSIGTIALGVQSYNLLFYLRHTRRPAARVHDVRGDTITLTRSDIEHARLRTTSSSWELLLTSRTGERRLPADAGLRAARLMLPALNVSGGSSRELTTAVAELERTPAPHQLVARVARTVAGRNHGATLGDVPRELRLAMEMVANEETERLASREELEELEAAWRSAEELAAIADNLILPPNLEEFISRAR